MKIKVLNKNATLVDGKVVVKRETEECLSREDLIFTKENVKRQKNQLIEQSKILKKQFDELVEKEKEINDMIKMLPEETGEEPVGLGN